MEAPRTLLAERAIKNKKFLINLKKQLSSYKSKNERDYILQMSGK